jgi:hypothetical protein
MTRWTYKTIVLKAPFLGGVAKDLDTVLTQAGNQGWELVSAIQSRLYAPLVLIFKREG